MSFGLTNALYETARAHHEAGRLALADHGYLQALAFDPRHFESLHMLAMAAGQQGQHERALHFGAQALAVRSDLPETHLNQGYSLASLGRDEEARASFRKALQLRPGYPEAQQALVALDERARQADQAPTA